MSPHWLAKHDNEKIASSRSNAVLTVCRISQQSCCLLSSILQTTNSCSHCSVNLVFVIIRVQPWAAVGHIRVFGHELRVITVPIDYHWNCVRRPFCFMQIIRWKLKIRLGNRAHCIRHAWIMLKSLVSHFYPKMHLTCTILRNASRLITQKKWSWEFCTAAAGRRCVHHALNSASSLTELFAFTACLNEKLKAEAS